MSATPPPAAANVFRLIPRDDLAEFQAESAGARRQVIAWLDIVHRLDRAPHGDRGSIVRAAAEATGYSPATINKKLGDYRRKGWRGLINRARYREPNTVGLPHAFRQWVPTLYARFQRRNAARQVHRYLLDRLARWRATLDPAEAIPGYLSPPANGPEGHPGGWSYRRICDLKPSTINLVTSRQGRKAASALLPSNYTTRQGLRFGQRIFYDDQVYDLKVNLLGRNSRAMRPHGFNALDHLSAAFVGYTAKMTLWDDAEERARVLKQKDFTWFNIRTLLDFGYRDDEHGTQQIFEHGTATGWNGFDDALYHVTGGRVTVERSGRFNDPLFSGMLFRPQSSGNFRFKAPLESIFNLVRNHMAALPGPVGQRFDLAPEELHGMDAYNRSLLKLYAALAAPLRERIRFPYLSWPEFPPLLAGLYHLINSRTDHALEGWERCGFVASRFRLDPSQPWQDRSALADLSPDRARAIAELAEWRVFPLSPAEVVAAHRSELTRLKPDLVPLLLPPEWIRDVKVTAKHEIHITDPDCGPEPFIYLAHLRDRTRGLRTCLEAGLTLRAFWHPLCAERCWLCHPDGAFLGVVEQFIRPTADDTPSIIRNQGRINALASDHAQWVERNLGAVRSDRQSMRDHNLRLANDQPVTPEERADARSASARRAASTRAAAADPEATEATWAAISSRPDPSDPSDLSDPSDPSDLSELL